MAESIENITADNLRQPCEKRDEQPSSYAEEKIADSGKSLATYSRNKAVSMGRKRAIKRAEREKASKAAATTRQELQHSAEITGGAQAIAAYRADTGKTEAFPGRYPLPLRDMSDPGSAEAPVSGRRIARSSVASGRDIGRTKAQIAGSSRAQISKNNRPSGYGRLPVGYRKAGTAEMSFRGKTGAAVRSRGIAGPVNQSRRAAGAGSIEPGRNAFRKKVQTSAVRSSTGSLSAADAHVKTGVKGVNSAISHVSAPLKTALEADRKFVASIAALLGSSAVILVVVSVILVMSLTLCSSFGKYNLEISENDLVNIALTQVGTESGEEYWSWYGFDHEVGWCACFVSWCANEAGMIRAGTMPKFAWCPSGVAWFQACDQWLDGSAVPEPGMITFYDWYDNTLDEEGEPIGQDGEADHVGIVEKVENGRIYTVESNTTDQYICAEKTCPVGYYEILGYGCPEF